MTRFTVQEELSLLDALQTHFPDSSRRTLQNWIKWGRVLVDGKAELSAHSKLNQGQEIELSKKEPSQSVCGLPILYQDRWLIVIDKPAGLLSVPAEKKQINALHILKAGFKSPSILPVHRLDQESSGVLLFARSKLAEERLSPLFEKHDLLREYAALIEGHLPQQTGTWECHLRERANFDVEVVPEGEGKQAITHYEVVHRSKHCSFLKLRLETGRKHQIRVQAAHTGYPIIGDKRYGSLLNPYKRLCLHACTLSFIHPFTQKPLLFTSKPYLFPFPADSSKNGLRSLS